MMHKYDIVTSIDGEIVVSVMPNLLLIIYTVYCVLSFKFQPVLRVVWLYPRTSKLRTADLIDRLEKWNKSVK